MSDETVITEDNDIEEEYKPKRNAKGMFVKGQSGNPKGRGTGNQSKINKTKIVTALNKETIPALNGLKKAIREAEKLGQWSLAMKGHLAIFEKSLSLVFHQDKLAADAARLRKKDEKEDEENNEDNSAVGQAILSFDPEKYRSKG